MKQRKTLKETREELKSQEKNIWNTIDLETKNLDKKVQKGIKSATVVGGVLLLGYTITRLLTSNNKQKLKKPIKPIQHYRDKSIGVKIVSTAVKVLVPIAVSKISEQLNSTIDEDPSENRRK